MNKDVLRWDEIHKKAVVDINKHSFYAEKCEKLFPRHSLICDLGGGLGFDALYFIKNGHKVVLLDISVFALKNSRLLAQKEKCLDKLLTKQADFGSGKLPLKENSVDIVFSRIGLNYFPYRETQIILSDIYRTLKPTGQAYLAFKSPDDLDEMKFLKSSAVEMEPGVYIEGEQIRSRFSIEQFKNMLKEIGIKDHKVTAFQESMGIARDEFGVSKDKPLYLNEVSFARA